MSNASNKNWEREYSKAIEGLLNDREIIEWKIKRALEEAKQISINIEFQKRIQELHEKWRITPQISRGDNDPWAVLSDRAGHLTEEEFSLLVKDLEGLAVEFNLDWRGEDEGLVIASLCYGLTSNNIINHWEDIKFIIARTRRPGVDLFVDHHIRIKEKLYYAIIIAHLATKLLKNGIKIELPTVLRDMLIEVLKLIGKVETGERANELFNRIREKKSTPELFIKITKDTTIQDIKRTWPQVELRKAEYFGPSDNSDNKRRRVWRTYDRDVFIWKKVRRDGITFEAAYDEWLTEHPDEQPVEISAVIKSVTRIKELPEETDFNPEN